jgi:hypothetical protein
MRSACHYIKFKNKLENELGGTDGKNFIIQAQRERFLARDESLSGRASARIKPNIRKSESYSRTYASTHKKLNGERYKTSGNPRF